jgi:DNA helicase-2/ATP-dependent DNA helicase PcrA
MGISAVPGSGKTWTLSYLAADLLRRHVLEDRQEILIVTLVNSAVDNFYNRIGAFIEARGMIPNIGYRVRTLHGLAHDIVRERPDLLGLDPNFSIIDERESDTIRDGIAQNWLIDHPNILDPLLDQDIDSLKRDWVIEEQLPTLVKGVAENFIRIAKDNRYTPELLRNRIKLVPLPSPLAEMGLEMYESYQNALMYRGAVDFDDLIRLAVEALELDPSLLKRLRQQWPYILEDEAQDSSLLQEEILNLLTGDNGNWVRVGDSNQAIYETFTTANPEYFRRFLHQPNVISRELPNSGRSTLTIINLANYLVRWTHLDHPNEAIRNALSPDTLIEPAPPGDPQPNPPDDQSYIHISPDRFTPEEEIQTIVDSVERWLPDHQGSTVAILAPRNIQAFEVVDELRRRNISYNDDLLRSSSATRFSAGSLGNILRYLADPDSPSKLAVAYRVWKRESRNNEIEMEKINQRAELLQSIPHVEDFIWPLNGSDWLEKSGLADQAPDAYQQFEQFRQVVRRWQSSIILPIDQVILVLAQDLLTDPSELAVAHKLAVLLGSYQAAHPEWPLSQLTEELVVIARNERRFLGFSESDFGFEPDIYKGKVILSTMHKAKGLEWDRVYLMSVNNYDFPSGESSDPYIAQKWFVRNALNIQAESLAQLKALIEADENKYVEGQASVNARLDYARERLRLLYVAVTRAKKELIISWNTGRNGEAVAAIPLIELYAYLEKTGRFSHAPA